MSKADRQRKRDRAKADWKAAVKLAPVPKRSAQPRNREGRFERPPEDLQREALDGRCRRFGVPVNASNREKMKSPWMGCDLGFVIETRCTDRDAARLWDVFSRWSRAETTYRARYLGQGEQPASAALQMIPDRMETDQSAAVDVREPEERDRDAVTVWMRWQGFLGHLPVGARKALHEARREEGREMWVGAKPTDAGLAALDALRGLAEVSERKHP